MLFIVAEILAGVGHQAQGEIIKDKASLKRFFEYNKRILKKQYKRSCLSNKNKDEVIENRDIEKWLIEHYINIYKKTEKPTKTELEIFEKKTESLAPAFFRFLTKGEDLDDKMCRTLFFDKDSWAFYRYMAGFYLYFKTGEASYMEKLMQFAPYLLVNFKFLRDDKFKQYAKNVLVDQYEEYIHNLIYYQKAFQFKNKHMVFSLRNQFVHIIDAILNNLDIETSKIFIRIILSNLSVYKNEVYDGGVTFRPHQILDLENRKYKNVVYKIFIEELLSQEMIADLNEIVQYDKKGVFTDILKAETKKWLEQREKQEKMIREILLKENSDQKKDAQSTK